MTRKITDAVAEEVLRLYGNETDPSEIAQRLNLKKAQVTAIIAYLRPPKGSEGQAPAASGETNGDRERPSQSEESTERSQLIEEYSADPEPEPTATRPRTEENVDCASQDKDDEGVFIGNESEYGDAQYWNPQDTAAVTNPHMMIVGESGSGKTYATLSLTAELAHRGLPTIIFDYAQGFEIDQLDEVYKKYVSVQEFRIGEDGISLNPLQIFANDAKGPYSVAARVSDVFDAVYHLGHIQRKVLIEGIIATFEKVGVLTSVPSSWKSDPPTFAQLQQTLDDFASDKG